MKFIFVMGGVISGLGKGITSASIGRLLKSSGYKVNIIKMDPYFQVDAGTMSPYEHGEVFVTDDGGETDLDLGHYERFIDESLNKNSSITTGKIYSTIIEKERNGDYLGQTVQVIPHVTNEIKKQLLEQGKNYDFNIIEIGGVIGDIEGPHFTEAIRQLRNDLGEKNVFYILVAPLLYVKCSGEFKTKPIQHAYKELTRLGIWADMIICRSENHLSEKIKNKISLFCNIDKDSIIEGLDVETIYQIPILYHKQKVNQIIQQKMGIESPKKANLTKWNKIVDNYLNSENKVNILIVGKYTAFQDTYLSVTEALKHAGIKNKVSININWVESQDLEKDSKNTYLKKLLKNNELDGVVVPGGFGDRGIEGKIQTVKFCRENNIPFLGLCLGLQISVIEFARNICNIKNANSYEFDSKTSEPVIAIMNDQKNIVKKGGTMRLGSYKAILKPGTLVHDMYGKKTIEERHRHRYEVNPRYSQILEDNGLIISGKSPDGDLVEFIELPNHKYFIATQAHPEFKSRIDKPHPLFDGFIKSIVG